MDPKELLKSVRANMAKLLAKRQGFTDTLASYRAKLEADDESVTEEKITETVTARRELDAEIDVLQAREAELVAEIAQDEARERLQAQITPAVRELQPAGQLRDGERRAAVGDGVITREERVYSAEKDKRGVQNGGTSWFRDMLLYKMDADLQARERLERYSNEVRVHNEGGQQARATNTTSFAGLVVPQYLVDLAALAARNGRPFANGGTTRLELPDSGMQIIIPRGTTGATALSQATENSSVSSTDEVWANLTVNVVTIAGQQDVSRQSIERGTPGIDQLIYRDLAGAYAAELDRQVLAGTGASGQMLGLQSTSGINQATAFGAAVTATTFYTKFAGGISAIDGAGTVVAPANIAVMHPRRFAWLLGQVDSQGRPLVTPTAYGQQVVNAFGVDLQPGAYSGNPQNASTNVDFAGYTLKGEVQGIPIITDANVPTAVGTGPEDLVWIANKQHLLLWENGDGMPVQLRFEQTLGNQLTVKLVIYNYAAFTAGRYPTAVSQLGGNATVGNGLIAPTF